MREMLELGSVVCLKGSEIPMMVIGYYPQNPKVEATFEYLCTSLMMGVTDKKSIMPVMDQWIDKVLYHGYRNGEADRMLKWLDQHPQ